MNINKLRKKVRSNKASFLLSRIIYIPYKTIKEAPVRKNILAEARSNLSKASNHSSHIFYFGIPMHTNLGDLAQCQCIKKWCEENYPDLQIIMLKSYAVYDKKFQKELQRVIRDDDMLIIQSGYCTKETHRDHIMHRYIVNQYPDNRIVIFPQTVAFKEQSEFQKTADIYNQHRHLLFLARDEVSYQAVLPMFKNITVLKYPDIVTTLIGRFKTPEVIRGGVLFCIRDDGEKLYSDSQIAELRQRFKIAGFETRIMDTKSNLSNGELLSNLDKYISDILTEFSKYSLVITDRYHGTIFSLVANTPVIVLATNDHKVVTGLNWFENVYDDDAFYFADSIETVYKRAIYILDNGIHINNNEYFNTKYYKELRAVIQKL